MYAEAVAPAVAGAPEAARGAETENVDGRHRLSSRLPVGCSTSCSRGPLAGLDHVAPLPGGDQADRHHLQAVAVAVGQVVADSVAVAHSRGV